MANIRENCSLTPILPYFSEVVRQSGEHRAPLGFTHNNEAKVVIMDIASYEAMQETMALLKILALGNRNAEMGTDLFECGNGD